MKAILLAGGTGSRLFPVTLGVSKQLLPVYDKPMVYYPLSVLLLAGIREVLLISTPQDIEQYQRLFGDGSQWGITIVYKIQEKPNGLAAAFLLGEEFIGQDPVCLILGDNIFFGLDFSKQLQSVVERTKLGAKATIFGYIVKDPQRYGVIEFDDKGAALSIEEKPGNPKSDKAVVGLYFYPNEVVSVAKQITPSARGELEITAVNQYFLEQQQLHVELLGRGFAWLDTGTHESLMEASQFIQTIEKRQGLKIGCIEEVAFKKGYITLSQLLELAQSLQGTSYGDYLLERYS
ncbi:glucose-1-phosphate thymidylyltransferase RfbA [Flavobacteriaceae bacterium]|nr:glucose-1-phosphate thymidylyltransferase RfbA [Flavobacteriaceae bacterium]